MAYQIVRIPKTLSEFKVTFAVTSCVSQLINTWMW